MTIEAAGESRTRTVAMYWNPLAQSVLYSGKAVTIGRWIVALTGPNSPRWCLQEKWFLPA
jgi:hypothetical protein